jgi:glycosyltransferase involved in cell wall biosynthesis
MPSLRILQILPSLAPETGGPTTSLPGIGRSLAKLGHEVVLYTTTWPACEALKEPSIHADKNGGYQVVTFPAQKSRLFPNLPYSPALVQAVAKNCDKFDIVHNFSLWNPVATFSLRALRRSNSLYCVSPLGMLDPVVLRRHPWKKLPWRLFWERANIEGAALIHFTTELEEERAKSYWRLNRSVVIPHAVNLGNWETLPDRSVMESRFPQIRGREVILFVGRINWVKNLDILQMALAKVIEKRPKAILLCVGPDNDGYRPVLEKQAQELGISDRILYTGMLQGDDLKAAYACGDTLALVSQKENFGHSAAEALACGIPVVLSNGVGVGSNWPASNVMFRVEPDPDSIASALIRSLERRAATGFPDMEARSLAKKFFHNFEGGFLVAAFYAVLSHCRPPR